MFVGKASCIDCHYTPLFSDGEFHDIGVPQTGEHVPTVADCTPATAKCDCTPGAEKGSCFPAGAWAGLTKLAASVEKKDEDCATRELNFNNFRRDSCWSDGTADADPVRQAIIAKAYEGPPDASYKGAWRTPSLRDVALTAPYMHDGVYATLDEVVWHYNTGAGGSATSDFLLPVCGSGALGWRRGRGRLHGRRGAVAGPRRPDQAAGSHHPRSGGSGRVSEVVDGRAAATRAGEDAGRACPTPASPADASGADATGT